ncbi:MAG: cytochrome C [Leptospira sp.]|nr:cytochrome C [Leptospira sp.]
MKEPKEVDGIFQADNPMPTWWKLVWLITIIGSIGYVFYFHFYSEWPQEVAFEKEVTEHETKFPQKPALVVDATTGENPYRGDAGPERQKLNRGGMPPWEGLGAEKVYAVMAWLATKNQTLVKTK